MLDTNLDSSINQDQEAELLFEHQEVHLPSSDGADNNFFLDIVRRQPLLSTFGPEIAAQFIWAVSTDTIETYEHRETFRFLHIDGVTLECLNQNCEVISSESALQHALRPGAKPVADLVEELVAMDSADLANATGALDWTEVATFEPELMPFVRKMSSEAAVEDGILQPAHSSQQGALSGLSNLIQQTKRLWLGSLLSWSDPLIARAEESISIQKQIAYEPNFAPFTRRTTAS